MDRVAEVIRHLAVLIAHQLTARGRAPRLVSERSCRLSGLAVDLELRNLLDPPPPIYAQPIAR